MKKIIYQDIESLICAMSEISKLRRLLGHTEIPPQMFWRGPEGIFTYLNAILSFYEKYLSKDNVFKHAVNLIMIAISKIPKAEIDKHILMTAVHKETFLDLVNAVEEFHLQILQHYSLNTLFQFTNITFNSDILFSCIAEVFEEKSWEFIPDSAKQYIVEGGRALLFNLPTSASFLFLRALEDCIRKICSRITEDKKHLTFGAAIDVIIKEKQKFDVDGAKFDRQISFLKYIKDEFRNPSAHPDKSFSQKEAEQLFQVVNVAVDKLSFLYSKIRKFG